MKRILLVIITTFMCTTLVSTGAVKCASSNIRELKEKDNYTFLICGVDDAAENTDAIIVFNYNVKSNVVSFLQIPRDTYFNFNDRVKKINSIYPSLRAKGATQKEAMSVLSQSISDSLGLYFDGYMCFTVTALENLIDAIGGIDLCLPNDIDIKDSDGNNRVVFQAGNHHIGGRESIRFIRYREGYALGDLGRVDAQKLFLSAFVSKLKGSLNFKLVARSAFKSDSGIVTDMKMLDILGIAIKLRGRIEESDVKYANLPGVAAQSENGGWFYFVNKNASKTLLWEMRFNSSDIFDKNEKFLNAKSEETMNYYFNNQTKWRIVDEADLLSSSIVKESA